MTHMDTQPEMMMMMKSMDRRVSIVFAFALGLASAAAGCGRVDSPRAATAQATPQTPARVGDPADWCKGHAVPESMCPKCNDGVATKYKAQGDWCAAHGFPESVCPSCNPMQPPGAKAAGAGRVGDAADWCKGHALPESMCAKCNDGVAEKYKARGDWCDEHGHPESVCPKCNPMQPPGGEPSSGGIEPGTRVRLGAPSLERTIGLEAEPARARALGRAVRATARVDFDRNAMADVRSAVPGVVREVAVDFGQRVAAGDPLFVLESAQVGDLQAQRRAARGAVAVAKAHLARQEELREGAIASQRQVEVARQELAAAEAGLRSIDQSLSLSGAERSGRRGRFTIHAPIDGVVVRRPALLGTFADPSESLATIADTSAMWAVLDLPEWHAAAARVGQPVEVRVDGVAGQMFAGTLTWIASEVDPRTRAVAARATLDNPAGVLRAGQFARATVQVAAPLGAVTVPRGAVQRVGDESVVFVRLEEGVYEVRRVAPGRSDAEHVQVAGELHAGDDVVTTGAFLLRTELSKDSIGAGCCDVEPLGGS